MSAAPRRRADLLLVEHGLADSRTRAQALIMAGRVLADDKPVRKAGDQLSVEAALRLRGPDHPWAGRGGLKLEKALDHFAIDPAGAVCLDIGASTGGFTDVLLTRGARRVYAVDVGRDQLVWRLRNDPRVLLRDGVNARNLSAAEVPEPVDLLVCDVSFIGLEKVLPAAMALSAQGARLVALIKPQFQVGKGQVGKGGIVRDPILQQAVCREITDWLNSHGDWRVGGVIESPLLGAGGNREFLIYACRVTE